MEIDLINKIATHESVIPHGCDNTVGVVGTLQNSFPTRGAEGVPGNGLRSSVIFADLPLDVRQF